MDLPQSDPSFYGEQHADVYDRIYAQSFSTDLAVQDLADRAERHHGPVLDLGVGTGRLAIPLHRAGIEVHGLEGSPAMIEQMGARTGAADIPVFQADMANFDLPADYGIIVCAVSTLFMIPTRSGQISCLSSARRALSADGIVMIEGLVPNPCRYDVESRRVELRHLDDQTVHLVVSEYEPTGQTISIDHVFAGPGGVKHHQVTLHYAWPLELDLMATQAGLRLVERFGGWNGQPFTSSTNDHVSIYAPAGPD